MRVVTLYTDELNITLLKLLSLHYVTVVERVNDKIVITLCEKNKS